MVPSWNKWTKTVNRVHLTNPGLPETRPLAGLRGWWITTRQHQLSTGVQQDDVLETNVLVSIKSQLPDPSNQLQQLITQRSEPDALQDCNGHKMSRHLHHGHTDDLYKVTRKISVNFAFTITLFIPHLFLRNFVSNCGQSFAAVIFGRTHRKLPIAP